MSYNNLREEIRNNITSNNNQEITGEVLQEVLLDMVEQMEDGDKQIEDCLSQCESQFEQLSGDLEQTKGDLEQTKSDLQDTNNKLEDTRSEIAQKNSEFESSLEEISGEVESNKRQIGEVQQTAENNSTDIETLKSDVNNRYTKQEIDAKENKLREDVSAKYAKKDGAYPKMTVGKADALNTPSGSILHSQFVRLGAVWNDSTKFWELNGLTDLTTSQMETIWDAHITMGYCQSQARTNFPNNFWRTGGYGNSALLPSNGLFAGSSLEVVSVNNGRFANMRYMFSNSKRLRKVVINMEYSNTSGTTADAFLYCTSLTELYLYNVCKDIDLSSCPLTIDSIVYIITYSRINNSVITLRSDIYQQAIADERVQEALTTHTNITLAAAE